MLPLALHCWWVSGFTPTGYHINFVSKLYVQTNIFICISLLYLVSGMTFSHFCAQLSIIRNTFGGSLDHPSLTETWNFLRFRERVCLSDRLGVTVSSPIHQPGSSRNLSTSASKMFTLPLYTQSMMNYFIRLTHFQELFHTTNPLSRIGERAGRIKWLPFAMP